MFVTVTVVGVGYISLVISLKCLVGIPNGADLHEVLMLLKLLSYSIQLSIKFKLLINDSIVQINQNFKLR